MAYAHTAYDLHKLKKSSVKSKHKKREEEMSRVHFGILVCVVRMLRALSSNRFQLIFFAILFRATQHTGTQTRNTQQDVWMHFRTAQRACTRTQYMKINIYTRLRRQRIHICANATHNKCVCTQHIWLSSLNGIPIHSAHACPMTTLCAVCSLHMCVCRYAST